MTFDVEITGFSRVRHPKPNQGGSTILAYFDATVSGVGLMGCAFVRTARGGLVCWPPRLDNDPTPGRRAVVFVDGQLRAEMVRQAQITYRLLGGTDGEWCRFRETPEEAADRVAGASLDPAKERNRLAAARRISERAAAVEDDDAEGLLRVLAKG